jgi:oxaloacetate decarboxylase alpha subunit
MSGGTSQYSTESMAYSLRQLGYEVDLNDDVLKEINDYYKPIKDNYIETGLLDPYVMGVQTDALTYQIPGGMLSNLIAQLKAQKSIDRLDEVLEETPKVRAEFGYPPLVTPMSQMVGVQAVSNVITGERYKNISNEVRAYVRGEYGTPPGEIDPEIVKIVLGDEKRITTRFADTLEPQFENFKKEIGEYAKTDEDVLSYALFPTVAENFLKKRTEEEENRATYTIVEA